MALQRRPSKSLQSTTRAISALLALDVRSSRWIAKISARARRLSRPQSCWTDPGMVRTSRIVHGVAFCAQFAWSPKSHQCGFRKQDATIAGPTFSLAKGRVEASSCSAAPDSSGVAAPARVRSAVSRMTAGPPSSGSTRGRVSDISCWNSKTLATFFSTYRYGAVDAHRCGQARELSSAKTWRNCVCSRAS